MTAINAVYPSALDAFLTGAVDYLADTIAVAAVSDIYEFDNTAIHLADIPTGVRIATATLAGKATSGGQASADAVTMTPAAGDVISALVVHQVGGTEATSRLLAYIGRRADTVPLSLLTNGQALTISWPLGYVFKI